jgi:hypothetical protein
MSTDNTEKRWFRLPEIGDGSGEDPYRPDTFGHAVAVAGNKSHPGAAPYWICRVAGPPEVLDALAAEPRARDLSNLPVQALNNVFGQNRNENGWKRGFDPGEK